MIALRFGIHLYYGVGFAAVLVVPWIIAAWLLYRAIGSPTPDKPGSRAFREKASTTMIPQQIASPTTSPIRAQFEPSRASATFAGELEPLDPRQTRAFGYTAEVAVDRPAHDAAICRDDDGEHVDINARTVDVCCGGEGQP